MKHGIIKAVLDFHTFYQIVFTTGEFLKLTGKQFHYFFKGHSCETLKGKYLRIEFMDPSDERIFSSLRLTDVTPDRFIELMEQLDAAHKRNNTLVDQNSELRRDIAGTKQTLDQIERHYIQENYALQSEAAAWEQTAELRRLALLNVHEQNKALVRDNAQLQDQVEMLEQARTPLSLHEALSSVFAGDGILVVEVAL